MTISTTDAPDLSVVLEFSRSHDPADPYAFRFEPETYTLRTEGGGRLVLEIDWGPELLADLEAVRRPDRDPAVVQRLGERMAGFLERASWPSRAEAIAEAHDEGRGVIITIRSNAAELYALPWELLTLPGRGQHLGSLSRVLLRYERPETRTTLAVPSPRPEGGRILLAWSAAAGAVPAAAHEAALRRACARGHPHGEDALEVLPHASVEGIAGALRRAEREGRPFAALHVLCHGGRKGQTFGLVLDRDGRPVTVAADTWRTVLARSARSLRLVLLAACDGGNAGEPGNHLGSVAQAVHAAGLEAVVASRYPLSGAGSVALAESLYEGLLCEHESLEEALLRARMRLALDPVHLDWAAVLLHTRAADGSDTRPFVFRPYRGLLAFEAAQGAFFFGREAEREETLGDLDALVRAGKPRLLVVAGASGTGKSSLVRSGAVPDILAHREGSWEHAIIRPGTDPMGTLDAALAGRDEDRPFLLVVDQFEEIFTHTQDRELRSSFARRLWALVSEPTGICCILSLRVDFMGRCGELRLDDEGTRLDTVAYDEAHRVFVAQMTPTQLRAAILRPAQRAGLTLHDGLAERIVAEVGMEPGALPLMQYTLDLMWQSRQGRELSAEVYDELGGVVGSLERRADELLGSLTEAQLPHARGMLTQLVGLGDDVTGDTRRRVPVEQLWPAGKAEREEAERVLGRFVDERLVVRDDRTRGGATVEIAHEALIRRWDRLREWLRDERDRRIGRYVVLEQLREGNTEEVFLGYDPDLDRRVTIKLLRVGRRGAEERARLRDQARALARLSHPNTLTVHDVGIAKGHVYLAMELVEGTPLRAWLAEQSRSWIEIVDVFLRAADGLAAAHRLGLVHRAFTPDAVLMDAEGVVRVIDFSLDRRTELTNAGRSAGTIAARFMARKSGQSPAASLVVPSRVAEPSILITGTETSVTIDSAYLPPERLRGHALSPASDQFGFCVSLYELLFSERPFEGDSMTAFVRSLTNRQRAPGAGYHGIPERLRKVLLRGLSAEPEQRWPSMEALATELRRMAAPRRWRGRIIGLSIGVVGVAGVAGALTWQAQAREAKRKEQCSAVVAELTGVWDGERRAAVREAVLGTGAPHAADAWARLGSALDRYAEAWVVRRTEVCEATTVREEQTQDVMDLRVACLRDRQSALREAVGVLGQLDRSQVGDAIGVVSRLPTLSRCDDVEALAAAMPLPEDLQQVEQVGALRAQLERASALTELKQYEAALTSVEEVIAACDSLDYAPLLAEALLHRGVVRSEQARYPEAERDLEQAYVLAIEHGHRTVEAEAASALVQVVGVGQSLPALGLQWGTTALALARSPHVEPEIEARTLDRVAAVLREAGRVAEAQAHWERALAIEQELRGPEHPDVASMEEKLGLVLRAQGHESEALGHLRRALAVREQVLGSAHPEVARLREAIDGGPTARGEPAGPGEGADPPSTAPP